MTDHDLEQLVDALTVERFSGPIPAPRFPPDTAENIAARLAALTDLPDEDEPA